MNHSDDYKRGWYDGFNAAKTPHAVPPPNLTGPPTIPHYIKCTKCNILFQDAVGYYCPRNDCPTFLKVT